MANQFMGASPRTHISIAQIPGFPYYLKATVTASCPACKGDANIGGTTDGNTFIKCDCGHTDILKGKDSGEVVKEFFAQMSKP